MDSSQQNKKSKKGNGNDPAKRRALRKKYFNLSRETYVMRTELKDPNSAGDIQKILGKGEKLFSEIAHAREGCIDSGWFQKVTGYCLKQLEGLHLGKNYDVDELIEKVRVKYKGESQNDVEENILREEDSVDIDWEALGNDVGHFFNTVPQMQWMKGPLNIQIKQRKKAVRRKRVEGEGETPEVLEDDDREELSTKYVKNLMEEMQKRIKSQKKRGEGRKLDLLELLVDTNPESGFTKTIENFFYYSFLIKENGVSMELDNYSSKKRDYKLVGTTLSKKERQKDLNSKQSILKLDLKRYKKLVEIVKKRRKDKKERPNNDQTKRKNRKRKRGNEGDEDENTRITKKRKIS